MTDLRQAAQQALVALEAITRSVQSDHQAEIAEDAITALRTALVQQAEPVAWAVQACSKMWRGEFAEIDAKAEAKRIGGTCVAFPLYTTPPQRPWVGLTDEDWGWVADRKGTSLDSFDQGAAWAQQRLKELNK